MRLIDANELCRCLSIMNGRYGKNELMRNIIECYKDLVDMVPSIDIVRCGECKHWNNETDMTYCDRTVWFGTDADDYCSFGEVERSE